MPSFAWPSGGTVPAREAVTTGFPSTLPSESSLGDQLGGFEIDHLIDVQTFVDVEKEIARNLKERVLATADTINVEEVRQIATRRQAGHWAMPTVPGTPMSPRGTTRRLRGPGCRRRILRSAEPPSGGIRLRRRLGYVPRLRKRTLSLRPTLPALLRVCR